MKDKIKYFYDLIDNKFYFRLFYLFVSLTMVTCLKEVPGIGILNKIALAWGIILVIFMTVHDYKRTKISSFDVPLGIFMGVSLAFTIIFYPDAENFKVWVVNLVLFVAVFTVEIFKNKKKLFKEIKVISRFFSVFMMTASIVSLIMWFGSINITIGNGEYGALKGGVFENSNAISIAAAISVILSIYLRNSAEKAGERILCLINVCIQIPAMIIYEGRSAWFIFIALGLCFIFVYINNKWIKGIIATLPVIGLLSMPFFIGSEQFRNFTSGRASLWESAQIVIKEKPLTGVGFSGMAEAVINARETDDLPGLLTGRLHNIYIETAAVNGVLLSIMIILFIILFLNFIIKRIRRLSKKEKFNMTILTSLILGIAFCNIFESNLINIISFISMIFWIFAGYIMSVTTNRNIE